MSRFGKRLFSICILMLLGVLFGMQLAGSSFNRGDNSAGKPAVVKTEPVSPVTESVPAPVVQQEDKEPRLYLLCHRVRCLAQSRAKHQSTFWPTKRQDFFKICLITE